MTVGAGGWVTVYDSERGVRAYVRFDLAPDGHLYPTHMIVQAHDADGIVRELRGVDLRSFPLAVIEAEANGPARSTILKRIDRDVKVRFVEAGSRWQRKTPGRMVEVEVGPGDVRELKIPTTRPYPDEFYSEVADAYTATAAQSRRPAADIAAAAGVPVKTVHSWIAEARRRGHLPPGRPGKAG